MAYRDFLLDRLDWIARCSQPVTREYVQRLVQGPVDDQEFPRLALAAANSRLRELGQVAREVAKYLRTTKGSRETDQ